MSASAENLHPDIVLLNGVCLTQSPTYSTVEALAISGERISAVGSNSDIEKLTGPQTRVFDLGGRTVVPGLTDTHAHPASYVHEAQDIPCRDFYEDVPSIREIQRRIRERAVQTPLGRWIVARGSPMQELRLDERRFPVKEELDEVCPDHPAYVTFGYCITVANSLALKQSGITRDTPSPPKGTVVKASDTGEPTGLLRDAAQALLARPKPDLEPESLAEGLLTDLTKAARRGVTTVHEIVKSRVELQAYQLLEREGRLPLRVQLLVRVIDAEFSKESLLDLGLVQGFGNDWLRLGGIKMSIDGGFSGKSGAFSEPLAWDGDDNPGVIRIEQAELEDTVWRYHQLGMRVCLHAIGDVAMDMGLTAIEKALARLPRTDHRHRGEHYGSWLMTPERIARARRLGMVLVPNATFLYYLSDGARKMLGPQRSEHLFPYRTLLENGFPLTFGSDGPGLGPIDPLRDIGTAISRKTRSGEEVNPKERISLADGLRAQTVNAAYAGFQEAKLGTLEPGKLADLAVLGEDPFRFPPERFSELPVDLTIVGGRIVHQREGVSAAEQS